MNDNIDLTKILKDCPIGWEFYSSIHGNVKFLVINNDCDYPILFIYYDKNKGQKYGVVTEQGLHKSYCNGECTLFPSKDQRDWSKFTAPWYKKEKFDPKTLQPFDKILVKRYDNIWVATLLSHSETHTYGLGISYLEFTTINNGIYESCIPYNEDTKHLVGTTDEAPEYYRYWED